MHALRLALRAGFGLSSRDELRELCVHLWAKSPVEAEVVRAAFANLADAELLADWSPADVAVPEPGGPICNLSPYRSDDDEEAGPALATLPRRGMEESAEAGAVSRLIMILISISTPAYQRRVDRGLVLVPQYPLTAREVAQAWRHLRRPVRSGPAMELDVEATIAARARRGVATPPVLVPRRRNAVRLLMLIDRQGSMTPFHGYVDYVVGAIRHAARIDDVQAVYFHDLPGSLADKRALDEMPNPFRPDLDEVLSLIEPLRCGRVYDEPTLTAPRPLDERSRGHHGNDGRSRRQRCRGRPSATRHRAAGRHDRAGQGAAHGQRGGSVAQPRAT